MGQKLVTKVNAAKHLGISPQALHSLMKCGLKDAVVGKRFDLNAECALKYAKDKKKKKKVTAVSKSTPTKVVTQEPVIVIDDLGSLADLTLRELIQKFGTETKFLDWLKATKMIEDINGLRIKNGEKEGTLVSRHGVIIGVIDPVNAAHIKLLTSGAKTIAQEAVSIIHSNTENGEEELELFIKEQITSYIKPMKAKIARTLKNV